MLSVNTSSSLFRNFTYSIIMTHAFAFAFIQCTMYSNLRLCVPVCKQSFDQSLFSITKNKSISFCWSKKIFFYFLGRKKEKHKINSHASFLLARTSDFHRATVRHIEASVFFPVGAGIISLYPIILVSLIYHRFRI